MIIVASGAILFTSIISPIKPNYRIEGKTIIINDTIAFIKEIEMYKAADNVLSHMNVDGTISNRFLFNKAVNKYRKLRTLYK